MRSYTNRSPSKIHKTTIFLSLTYYNAPNLDTLDYDLDEPKRSHVRDAEAPHPGPIRVTPRTNRTVSEYCSACVSRIGL